jgi:pimeloyl-ACP methyl ester carboxylesterase
MVTNFKAKTGTADIEGGKVYYEVQGTGETLVMAHTAFIDSGMWDAQWDEFAKHYQVVRYDMRGYGNSDPLEKPISRREELLKLLKHLGIERTYLLGCSLGGEVVIDFALDHPEMVAGLIAVSAVPSGFEMQGEPPRYMMEMMGAFQQGDTERISELQMRIWVDGIHREPEEVDAQVRQRAAEMNRIAVQNRTWGFDAQPVDPLYPPAVERLDAIQAPMLVIMGGLEHPEMLRAAGVMHSSIPNAQKVIIEGTSHVPNMEKPAEFNRAVLDFLNGIEQ